MKLSGRSLPRQSFTQGMRSKFSPLALALADRQPISCWTASLLPTLSDPADDAGKDRSISIERPQHFQHFGIIQRVAAAGHDASEVEAIRTVAACCFIRFNSDHDVELYRSVIDHASERSVRPEVP